MHIIHYLHSWTQPDAFCTFWLEPLEFLISQHFFTEIAVLRIPWMRRCWNRRKCRQGRIKSRKSHSNPILCPGEDLNLHGLLHMHLKHTRLPITPPGQQENYKPKQLRPLLLPPPREREPRLPHRSSGGACARRGAVSGLP